MLTGFPIPNGQSLKCIQITFNRLTPTGWDVGLNIKSKERCLGGYERRERSGRNCVIT